MRIKINRIILLMSLFGFNIFGNNISDNQSLSENSVPTDSEKEDVNIFVTTSTRSKDFKAETAAFNSKDMISATTIKLDPATRFQTLDGFGSAITGSTCYNLMQMTKEKREQFLKETFSPTEGMGQSYVRIAIGCSDFSLSEYSCWDDKNGGFGLTSEETDYVIPILKEILDLNPELKIISRQNLKQPH